MTEPKVSGEPEPGLLQLVPDLLLPDQRCGLLPLPLL